MARPTETRSKRVWTAARALLCLLLPVAGCSQSPVENTPEYLAAHGITPGRVNTVAVAGFRLRIPADLPVRVFTRGPIVKGQADELHFALDFSKKWAGTGAVEPSDRIDIGGREIVRVELHNRYTEGTAPGGVDPFTAEILAWPRVADRADLGLEEFVDPAQAKRNGQAATFYKATTERSPRGRPVAILCQIHPLINPTGYYLCEGRYQTLAGLTVGYKFYGGALDRWLVIERTVVDRVDQLILKDQGKR